MNKNFLITSVSTKVQLVKSLKAACDLYNVKLISSDLHENNAGLYFSHDYIILPRMDDECYISFLLNVCHQHNIGFIIPTRDEDLLYFSEFADLFKEKNILICQSPVDTIKICNNKFNFRKFCENNGFSVPHSYSDIQDVIYPCVVKKENSSGSNGVFIVKNKNELLDTISEYGSKLIIEQFINYKEYSIDAFFDKQGSFIGGVARERVLVTNGESKVSKTIESSELITLVKKLGEKLIFIGHIVIQAFYSNGSYYLIEINPRFGGASNLSIRAGLDSPTWLVSMMLNDNSLPIFQKYNIRYNLTMLRYSEDLFINGEI